MLRVFYGDMEDVVYNTVSFFLYSYEDDWITDPLCEQMILDVDRSQVISAHVIDSPVLGSITPRELSGGVQTLMLVYKVPDRVFCASACGDNCAKWLLEIGRRMDVTVNLRHMMDFGSGEFEIQILNTGEIVHSMKELVDIVCLLAHEEE